MFKINKTEEPGFFIEFKRRYSEEIRIWDDMNNYSEVKKKLRLHMLKEEQNYFCPYCEVAIDSEEHGNIEHIKPRILFNSLMLNYSNLITSCKSSHSCDNYKGGKWDGKFINPVEEDPKEYFEYYLDTGEIIPKEKSGIKHDKAKRTIEILGLNNAILLRIRKKYIIQMGNVPPEILCYYNQYPSLLEFYKNSIQV